MANLENVKKQFPNMTEEEILDQLKKAEKYDERTQLYGARKRVTDALYVMKAKKAGITVTKEEVEKILKQKGYVK